MNSFQREKSTSLSIGERNMDKKELKKILAGIGVIGLLAGGGVTVAGASGASG